MLRTRDQQVKKMKYVTVKHNYEEILEDRIGRDPPGFANKLKI